MSSAEEQQLNESESNSAAKNGPAIGQPVELRDIQSEQLAASWGGTVGLLMGCNLIVFMASVCIMVLELTASRLIAGHVGSSLYTWTSVIGVVLAGITVGNYLGGILADRFGSLRILGWLFLIASVSCLSVLWLDNIAYHLERPSDVSWPTWVFITVFMIFILPAIALGTISPVVAALALSRSKKIGFTVGNVYAWGAMGSIVGTFLTGFWLIDFMGTKAIVASTSATLAIMGVIVASGQRFFRSAVVFGWLQFVCGIGLVAGVESQTMASVGTVMDSAISAVRETFGIDDSEIPDDFDNWETYGSKLGTNLHELGLTLGLRRDQLGDYNDESNYSYIVVSNDVEEGDDVKYLKLDKLVHSYYNPKKPTELYYEYEQIYAAVTERVISSRSQTTSVQLHDFPEKDVILKKLPKWASYDPKSGQLSVTGGLSSIKRDELLAIHPFGEYWNAVDKLCEMTQLSNWGNFGSTPLNGMPDGVEIPDSLATLSASTSSLGVYYDSILQTLGSYVELTEDNRTTLLQAGAAKQSLPYFRTVESLFGKSRRVSTMFIGGGGFIFPRWIEVQFPYFPTIHVAELDPAVKLAVQLEMGLPADEDTQVKTFIGDARNFVDDQLQANKERIRLGQSPVMYDFVYGDAFNDFSVPWHLTTREFSQKVKQLLNPDGVYLVNVIDILSRSVFPKPTKKPDGNLEYHPFDGEVPNLFLDVVSSLGEWQTCPKTFESMEIYAFDEEEKFCIGVRGGMTDGLRSRLTKLAPDNQKFQSAMDEMYVRSRSNKVGRFLASYVNTVEKEFPHVYVFSTEAGVPNDDRDTFVIIASLKSIEMEDLLAAGSFWYGAPFASSKTVDGRQVRGGQMAELLQLANGLILTDDFAPVDNLLMPVFTDQ